MSILSDKEVAYGRPFSAADEQLANMVAEMQAQKLAPGIYQHSLPQQSIYQQSLSPLSPLSPLPDSPLRQTLSMRAREMFLKRVGGIRAELKLAEDDFLHCHIYGEQVFMFYCFSGRDGCVKENIDIFPSDQLVTQFRMVLAT